VDIAATAQEANWLSLVLLLVVLVLLFVHHFFLRNRIF